MAIVFVATLMPAEGLPWQASATLMPLAARMAGALPQQRPAAMPSRAFAIMHASAASLAAMCPRALRIEAAQQLAQAPTLATSAAVSSMLHGAWPQRS